MGYWVLALRHSFLWLLDGIKASLNLHRPSALEPQPLGISPAYTSANSWQPPTITARALWPAIPASQAQLPRNPADQFAIERAASILSSNTDRENGFCRNRVPASKIP
jgi:hypothetical protein